MFFFWGGGRFLLGRRFVRKWICKKIDINQSKGAMNGADGGIQKSPSIIGSEWFELHIFVSFWGRIWFLLIFLLGCWKKKEKLDKTPDWMSTKSKGASEHWNAKKCYFLLGIWRFWVDWPLKNLELLKMIKGEKDLGTCTYPTHVHPRSFPEDIQKNLEDAVICSFIPCEPN